MTTSGMLFIVGLAAFAALAFVFAACNLDDTRGIAYRVMIRKGAGWVAIATINGQNAAYRFADAFADAFVIPAGHN